MSGLLGGRFRLRLAKKIVPLRGSGWEAVSLSRLAERMQRTDDNASRHVRILTEAGLLSVIRSGRFKRR